MRCKEPYSKASGGHIRTQAPAVVVLLCRWARSSDAARMWAMRALRRSLHALFLQVCTLALACSNPHACRACTAAPPHADSSRILRVSENRTSQCNFQKPRKSKDMLSLVNSFVESLMALEEAPRGQEKYLSLSLHWKAGASSTSHLLALQSAPGPRLFEGSAACSCYCAKVQKRKAFSCSESKSCNWQPMTYACHPHADAAR